ncbi:MAG: hypothetical protein CMM91_08355 [Rickettsiales bacterium]|nr:hypothetical protein [Rickettsiales bacterium]|tara:strand:- start:718 stop:981 length:264 start_codon:yes stop_codon:yes gene_type:complete
MKKKLIKSLKRIKHQNPNLNFDKDESDNLKKLSPLEINIFRNLKEKYNISINEKIEEDSITKEKDISNEVRETLKRINKGLPFKFKK